MGDRGRWDTAEGTDIDWPKFMGKKKDELRRLNGVYNKMLKNAGVTYLEGRGKLLDRHTVDVDGKKYTARFLPPSVFFYPLAVGSADQEQFDRGVFDACVSPTLTVHILFQAPFDVAGVMEKMHHRPGTSCTPASVTLTHACHCRLQRLSCSILPAI